MVFNLLLNLGNTDLFIIDQLAFLPNLPRSQLYPSIIFFYFLIRFFILLVVFPPSRHIVLFSFVFIIENTYFPIIFSKINFIGKLLVIEYLFYYLQSFDSPINYYSLLLNSPVLS